MLLPKAFGLIRDVMVDIFVYSEDITCGRRVQMSASDIKFCILYLIPPRVFCEMLVSYVYINAINLVYVE